MSSAADILKQERKTNPFAGLINASIATEKSRGRSGRFFTAILFAFIVVFLLTLLTTGMNVYGQTNAQRESSETARLGLSLLVNSVRMNDTANAVKVGAGPEGSSLVLIETLESGSYETRIYAYKGKILQEYAMSGRAYTPERASVIIESEVFYFEYANNLLVIHTDMGDACIMLRGQVGA
ncbi:MAG: DUF4860 domain-containing protein [Eggerthellaceae bacterium]|nr:DUF4860 domain-containing protein [Eggerthellaceae bacterium]